MNAARAWDIEEMTLFNKIVLALGGAVSLAIIQAPAMAQDNDAEMEAFADLGAMFEVCLLYTSDAADE